MADKPRGQETAGDAVRSLAVLFGVIAAVVVAFTVMRPGPQVPDPVDYGAALAHVRAEYGYPVLAPDPVPDGWRATSVEHSSEPSGDRWRLGFLTGDDGFVGLEQTDGEIESYLADRLAEFSDDGTSRIAGTTWERRIGPGDRPDRALVRVSDGSVTIVLGTESYDVLESFAASLTS
ncbi:MAG TPA: DUF4245 domain-containing protein [Jiangellaceae bacterium]